MLHLLLIFTVGGAVHSFTNPEANNPPRSLYNPVVEKRSWQALRQFFAEIFHKHRANIPNKKPQLGN
ncbi:hypothetical protein [Nodularia sp. UHCC 0506]|uniref:hypothetical protein n=1 Tax=Nodularia sp. UHCC 0506 TaxID=3110243 RepID=UPI003A4C793C